MEVKWIKICTDIFDDEKILLIETLPEADSIIVIWFKLLCLAGKQNNDGVFIMKNKLPYTDEMLAAIMRRPINTVKLALKTFETYGMIEITDNVISVPNWHKHQSVDKLNSILEKNRIRQARYREGKKNNVTDNVTDNVTLTLRNALDKIRIDKIRIEKKEKEKEKTPRSPKGEGDTFFLDSLPSELNTAEFITAWKEWVEYRKQIKKKLTLCAVKKQFEDLKKVGPLTAIKVINESIKNSWTGLFIDKFTKNCLEDSEEFDDECDRLYKQKGQKRWN